jgi:hypothetical protein
MILIPSGNVILKSRRSRLLGAVCRVLSVVRRVPVLRHLWSWACTLEFESLLRDPMVRP